MPLPTDEVLMQRPEVIKKVSVFESAYKGLNFGASDAPEETKRAIAFGFFTSSGCPIDEVTSIVNTLQERDWW